MMKQRIHRMIFMGLAALTLGLASCSKSVYNEETYQKIIRYLSPVDSVDQRHTWKLTETQTIRFHADTGSDLVALRVFSANPLVYASGAELMTQMEIGRGETLTMSLSVPLLLTTLYGVLVDEQGNYYVKAFSPTDRDVYFTGATYGQPAVATVPMTYTYLFEEDFPQAGDYDYNDLVLRISMLRTGTKQVTINVTVSAVGGNYHMAGGIRLIGKRFQDVDSVRTTSGLSFNDGVPQGSLYMFDKTDMLLQGRNNEALINLFVDAHWAMAFNASVEYGLFKRMKYNVANTDGTTYQQRAERTMSYIVYFNTETGLNNFTLDSLDPFIITEYNGGRWETHLDQYRDAQVLFEYPVSTTIKDLPWALVVPDGRFKYAWEGVNIGFKKRTDTGVTALFGAYSTEGHAFGEWCENYQSSLDWYQYPTSGQVYN